MNILVLPSTNNNTDTPLLLLHRNGDGGIATAIGAVFYFKHKPPRGEIVWLVWLHAHPPEEHVPDSIKVVLAHCAVSKPHVVRQASRSGAAHTDRRMLIHRALAACSSVSNTSNEAPGSGANALRKVVEPVRIAVPILNPNTRRNEIKYWLRKNSFDLFGHGYKRSEADLFAQKSLRPMCVCLAKPYDEVVWRDSYQFVTELTVNTDKHSVIGQDW